MPIHTNQQASFHADTLFEFQGGPCRVCAGQSGTGAGLSPTNHYSTIALYAFIRYSELCYRTEQQARMDTERKMKENNDRNEVRKKKNEKKIGRR
jgi:hypothetical protein